MATDLSTANVVDTKSGTGWTITVTAANLLSDLSIKDFAVLIDSVVEPNTSFTKTSQTVLTYTGASIPSSTIEVRRITPQDRFQEITFSEKLSSTVFNEEIDRIIRKAYEYTLNGIGPGSVATTVTPLNEAYPGTWSGDTVRSRTANRLFEEFEKRPESAQAEAITGVWTAPTAVDATNNTQISTTAFAHTRVTNALASSPSLGGTPTSVTPATADDDTSIATTAYTRLATRDVLREESFAASRTGAGLNIVNNIQTVVTGYSEQFDPSSSFNPSTGIFTAPTNGIYFFNVSLDSSPVSGTISRVLLVGNTTGTYGDVRFLDIDGLAGNFFSYSGSFELDLSATETFSFDVLFATSGGANTVIDKCRFSGRRIHDS